MRSQCDEYLIIMTRCQGMVTGKWPWLKSHLPSIEKVPDALPANHFIVLQVL